MNKQKLFLRAAALALTACIFSACTPKATSLWCYGISARFEIEYAVVGNSSYDGEATTFQIKDEERFKEYLISAEGFEKTINWSDGDGEAYLFLQNGEAYYCGVKNNSRYTLAPCVFTVYSDDRTAVFVYPPTIDNHRFRSDGNSIAAVRSWSYFSDFYQAAAGTEVNEEEQTVTAPYYDGIRGSVTGTAVLTYSDGSVTFALSEENDA